MRKVITFALCMALILALAVPASAAKVSEMTYEELIQLRQLVDREILSRPEWKQATVPAGIYKVGVDIPAGTYSIRLPKNGGYEIFSVWGAEYEDYETDGGLIANESLSDDSPIFGRLELKAGNAIYISGPLVFAPPVSPFQF